jgi:hypothetical protein
MISTQSALRLVQSSQEISQKDIELDARRAYILLRNTRDKLSRLFLHDQWRLNMRARHVWKAKDLIGEQYCPQIENILQKHRRLKTLTHLIKELVKNVLISEWTSITDKDDSIDKIVSSIEIPPTDKTEVLLIIEIMKFFGITEEWMIRHLRWK